MENRIVIESIGKMKEIAKSALKGKWMAMLLGIIIYYVFTGVIPSVLDLYFSSVQYVEIATGEHIEMTMTYASPIYELVLTGPLMLGFIMFLLAFFRKHTIDYALTFEGFSMLGKGFFLYLMYAIRIFLWSLLFVIPGIIAAFRYSQAFYLRVDHPEWSSKQCLAASSRLMKGNKLKLLGLNLSFIGWYILATLPAMIGGAFVTTEIASLVVTIVLSIPVLFVDLYLMMTETVFYELLTGNLVVQERSPFDQFDHSEF